ncbi:NAD-dependent epimerase/dehydratase family protein [Botrimarina sp.]|uniref:NAD-dependent epimerase/dehydratase family protein n=1 Tax=Botrimarina sp. TaxID=2795802 RepID=UPI0032EAC65A
MPRTLVTGATGFIGKRLVRRLVERGDEVACLVRAASRTGPLEELGVALCRGELDDPRGLIAALGGAFEGRGAERLFHLAGLTHAVRYEDFHAANAQGTANLLRAAAEAGAPTVVMTSSLAAAGPSTPQAPHNEASPPAPISNYGRSKLAAEREARRLAGAAPISIVRPPVVFGPGDRDGLILFKSIRRTGLHVVPQRRGLPLSLVFADDLVEALLAVAQHGERLAPGGPEGDPHGLYYAADPAVSSYAEMGQMAAAAMGKTAWVFRRRKYPFLPVALAGDLMGRVRGKAPLFGMDKLREASASGWVCDPAKLIDQTGWAPTRPAAEHYAATYRWYVEHGWL